MKKLITILFCVLILTLSCGNEASWSRVEFDFFSLIIPPEIELVSQNDWLAEFQGEGGNIEITWSFDQFSRKNTPARESSKTEPGDKIIESTKAKLGDKHIWWNKTRNRDVITIRMTIPLDNGVIRLKGSSTAKNITNIEKSIRSVVIDNENYFIDSDS
ncbi:MAG: hypothetical protein KAH30_04385 [Caldisericia bacterium]|nr:hypothetical protein [Caldisericia bacterium]